MSDQEKRELWIMSALFTVVAFFSYLVGRRERRV